MFHLCVVVEVPQVDASESVHAGEESGVNRRPHDIIHIIWVVLKRVQRLVILQQREQRTVSWEIHEWVLCNKCLWMLCYLGAPEFNGPIKWRSQEEMREIYGSSRGVTVNACDWTMMPLKHLTDTCPTAHTHRERMAEVYWSASQHASISQLTLHIN